MISFMILISVVAPKINWTRRSAPPGVPRPMAEPSGPAWADTAVGTTGG